MSAFRRVALAVSSCSLALPGPRGALASLPPFPFAFLRLRFSRALCVRRLPLCSCCFRVSRAAVCACARRGCVCARRPRPAPGPAALVPAPCRLRFRACPCPCALCAPARFLVALCRLRSRLRRCVCFFAFLLFFVLFLLPSLFPCLSSCCLSFRPRFAFDFFFARRPAPAVSRLCPRRRRSALFLMSPSLVLSLFVPSSP